jgi:cell division septation protein DedD
MANLSAKMEPIKYKSKPTSEPSRSTVETENPKKCATSAIGAATRGARKIKAKPKHVVTAANRHHKLKSIFQVNLFSIASPFEKS